MITNAIARRYAKALVQLGAEEGAVEKFDAGDGDFCPSEPLEAEHGTDPGFYRTMILFNDIVEIFG